MKPSSRVRAAVCVLLAVPAASAIAEQHINDLADLSLEQLSELVVTSVSRRDERIGDAAASIYVIRREDIRRSGATTLAEALRLAPNLQVARVNANQYAITARGGNSTTANKLLVMIDGRSIYTPLHSGVFWDAQAVMLSEVDRIEVISGPGATLWGANAVNGVINVITRSASESQGQSATVMLGGDERYAAAHTGSKFGTNGQYRVYAMASEQDASRTVAGTKARDAGHHGQAGLRADWGSDANGFTLQTDIYRGEIDERASEREIEGANILGRMNRQLADGSALTVQAYWDHTRRVIAQGASERLNTFDIEFQHVPLPSGAHQLIWGGGYHHARDKVGNSVSLAFLPAQRTLSHGHVFVQDQWTLDPKWTLVAGLKLERNPYTGNEYLPNLRLSYKASEQSVLWGALSRAVRAPSRLDREFFLPGVAPYTGLAGGPNFRSEIANVLELGYRARPSASMSYSLTLFHHDYDRLRSLEPRPAGPQLENLNKGTTTGIEAWGSLQLNPAWRLHAGFTAMDNERRRGPGGNDTGAGLRSLGNDPKLTAQLRATYQLSERAELDFGLRHVGALPDPAVPAYTVADARFGWRFSRELELAVIAENLFDNRHVEWGNGPNASEFGREVMVKLLWRH